MQIGIPLYRNDTDTGLILREDACLKEGCEINMQSFFLDPEEKLRLYKKAVDDEVILSELNGNMWHLYNFTFPELADTLDVSAEEFSLNQAKKIYKYKFYNKYKTITL